MKLLPSLDDYKPTELEQMIIDNENMPEQVAIGYLRARRRDQMKKAKRK